MMTGLLSLTALLLTAPSTTTPAVAPSPSVAAPVQRAPANDEEFIPQLSVRGSAEIDKPADQFRISIGVVTENADATEAMDSNNDKMEDVIAALEKAGLGQREYQTGRFQIQPRYTQRDPRRADPDWSPRIVGYQVSNTVEVKTKQIDLAGEFIQAANKAGANSINNIRFDLADSQTHRGEAITRATINAMSDAKALAEAAGLQLVRVLSISLDGAQPPSPPIPMYGRSMAMESSADAAPVAPGDVTVRAAVTIVYEIAPR